MSSASYWGRPRWRYQRPGGNNTQKVCKYTCTLHWIYVYLSVIAVKRNLIKVRPLFTLSHRGSDNSPLLIVFKWTLYILCMNDVVMISTNQIAYFKRIRQHIFFFIIFKRLAYMLTAYCYGSKNLWRNRMLRQSATYGTKYRVRHIVHKDINSRTLQVAVIV